MRDKVYYCTCGVIFHTVKKMQKLIEARRTIKIK